MFGHSTLWNVKKKCAKTNAMNFQLKISGLERDNLLGQWNQYKVSCYIFRALREFYGIGLTVLTKKYIHNTLLSTFELKTYKAFTTKYWVLFRLKTFETSATNYWLLLILKKCAKHQWQIVEYFWHTMRQISELHNIHWYY
jgi:hypothetical protein